MPQIAKSFFPAPKCKLLNDIFKIPLLISKAVETDMYVFKIMWQSFVQMYYEEKQLSYF
jgi:hypothetical protein